ncbi:hypothetical protein [Phyllobacterium sp. SB3]|uniref:hypothetical protein n=1 Tax=Phyllobacterium sp. SB3 TaxID=3156073 RepID=UPI0032AF9AF8
MMKATSLIVLALCSVSFPGDAPAALSGFWDSSKALHAILGNNDVANALKQQPIETITKSGSGYTLTSHSCTVNVSVSRQAPNRPGQDRITIRMTREKCR